MRLRIINSCNSVNLFAKLSPFAILIGVFSTVSAQTDASIEFVKKARNNIIAEYNRQIHHIDFINNGQEYVDVTAPKGEHPFFLSEDVIKGKIRYAGTEYNGIYMQYDIWRDVLVIEHQEGYYRLQLASDFVESFELDSHIFLFQKESDGVPHAGYYEQVGNDDAVSVLVRHSKTFERPTNGKPQRFTEKVVYYVKDQSNVIKVNSKRSLLNCFPAQKETLKKFIRANHLHFYRDRRKMIIQVVGYYDSIVG